MILRIISDFKYNLFFLFIYIIIAIFLDALEVTRRADVSYKIPNILCSFSTAFFVLFKHEDFWA